MLSWSYRSTNHCCI